MSQKTNIYTEEWCELIFTEKNHEYGAYILRKKSWKRQLWAIIISITFFTVAISSPVILKTVLPKDKTDDKGKISFRVIEIENKKVEKNQEIDIPQPTKSTQKFDIPEIKPDDLVDDDHEMLAQDILNQSKLAISNVNHTGTDENYGDIPIDLDIPDKTGDKVNNTTWTIVQQMPEFAGGDGDLNKYIVSNTHYPVTARSENITGVVYVTFLVNMYGKIENVKILRGIGGGCDEEAIRVISSMPEWKPGKQNGNAVNVQLNIPINFKLNN